MSGNEHGSAARIRPVHAQPAAPIDACQYIDVMLFILEDGTSIAASAALAIRAAMLTLGSAMIGLIQ
jgi:hypothetical protein